MAMSGNKGHLRKGIRQKMLAIAGLCCNGVVNGNLHKGLVTLEMPSKVEIQCLTQKTPNIGQISLFHGTARKCRLT